MKTRQNLLVSVLLCVGLCMVGIGCGDDDGGEPDAARRCPGPDCPLFPDCEDNWVREEGINGRLYQAVTVTFRVPEEYDGTKNPGFVALTLTETPGVPVVEIPIAVGNSNEDAQLIAGEEYTYIASYVDRGCSEQEPPCGEYYYIAVGTYIDEPGMCTDAGMSYDSPEWVFVSDIQYQVGDDEEIVIEDAELVPNRL